VPRVQKISLKCAVDIFLQKVFFCWGRPNFLETHFNKISEKKLKSCFKKNPSRLLHSYVTTGHTKEFYFRQNSSGTHSSICIRHFLELHNQFWSQSHHFWFYTVLQTSRNNFYIQNAQRKLHTLEVVNFYNGWVVTHDNLLDSSIFHFFNNLIFFIVLVNRPLYVVECHSVAYFVSVWGQSML
jgi:hypothetical protein